MTLTQVQGILVAAAEQLDRIADAPATSQVQCHWDNDSEHARNGLRALLAVVVAVEVSGV